MIPHEAAVSACACIPKVMMKLQLPVGLEDEMHVMLLDKLLGAKFFEILRTQCFGLEKTEGLGARVDLGI